MQERWSLVETLSPTITANPSKVGRRLLVLTAVALVILADQLSKTWALNHLKDGPKHVLGPVKLVLDFNSGAAFSLGAGVTPIIEAVVVVLIVVLLLFSRRAARNATVATAIGLGLVLGGALGNLSDRVFRHHGGAVVDFIQAVGWWPIFNVADSAIVVGVIVLAVSLSRDPKPAAAVGDRADG